MPISYLLPFTLVVLSCLLLPHICTVALCYVNLYTILPIFFVVKYHCITLFPSKLQVYAVKISDRPQFHLANFPASFP